MIKVHILRNRSAHVLAILAFCVMPPAYADFQNAMKQYQSGQYDQARAEFLALAGLGDGASQYNLGAMSLEGQGGPKDRGAGVGWLQAARENGYDGISAQQLEIMRAKLSDEQRAAAAKIVAEYGHTALQARVLPGGPNPLMACTGENVGPGLLKVPAPKYVGGAGIMGIRVEIGSDGIARDPDLLDLGGAGGLDGDVQKAMVVEMFESQWHPGTHNGAATESEGLLYTTENAVRVEAEVKREMHELLTEAEAGDTDAEYTVAILGMHTDVSEPSARKAEEMLLLSAQGGNPLAQYMIATTVIAPCEDPRKQLPWLRQAAAHGHAAAAVRLAKLLLSPAPSPESIAEARTLLEQASHSRNDYAAKHAIALLAASEIDALRDPAVALSAARKYYWRRIEVDPQAYEAVAAAEAANANFAVAVERQETALARARRLHWNTARIEERLAAYSAGKMWRGDIFIVPPNPNR